mgnify:CR=1 FL=1
MAVQPTPAGPRRLLLIQLYHIGDVLLATPALRAARRAWPDAHIAFLTGAGGAEALGANPHADEVLVWRPGFREHLRMLRTLRRRGYDAVADLHSKPHTAQFTFVTGARIRAGVRGRGPRNLAYTHLVPRRRDAVYAVRQKLEVLRPLGLDPDVVDDLAPEIAIAPGDREWAAGVWRDLGLEGDAPVAAVSAVARMNYKQWGATRWAEVADRLVRANFRVLLTAGPGERAQVEAVAAAMRERAVLELPPTTLPRLAALYERCAVWVGNDGGPKHVAAAAGTPTVSVGRWRFSAIWNDLRPGSRQYAIDRAPAGGCDRNCGRCKHLGCLAAVQPVEVAALALEVARPGAGGT